jgi:hypothetical protein
MEESPSKIQILADMQAEWLLLEQTLHRLSEEQMLAPGVTGHWSVKDDLAHINAWEKVLLDRIEGLLTGQPLKYPPILNNDDVDLFNNRTYLENRERSLASVQLEFRSLYNGLLTVLEALDEATLTRPVPWDWASDDLRLWHIIIANTSDHYREHRLEIERALDFTGFEDL